MSGPVDIDHTSFAVQDALRSAQRLRRQVGAVPVAGETLAEFRYVLLYVGTTEAGARLELIEPVRDGFLQRYLHRHGEGPHHVTFMVADLPAAVDQVRASGFTVVGERYGHPAWQEAFVAPDPIHGTVIQLAQSDRTYPTPRELLASQTRTPNAYPSVEGATEPLWWTSLWDTPRRESARLGATLMASTDIASSRHLFGDVLDGSVSESGGGLKISWPSGAIQVHGRDQPGVLSMELDGGPAEGVPLGSVVLGRPA